MCTTHWQQQCDCRCPRRCWWRQRPQWWPTSMTAMAATMAKVKKDIGHDDGQRQQRRWPRQWPTSMTVGDSRDDGRRRRQIGHNDGWCRRQRQLWIWLTSTMDRRNNGWGWRWKRSQPWPTLMTKTHPDLLPVISLPLSLLAEVQLSSSKVVTTRSWRTGGKAAGHLAGAQDQTHKPGWWHYEGDDYWPLVGQWPLAWQSVDQQRMAAGYRTTSWRRISSQPMCLWWWCARTYAWLMM